MFWISLFGLAIAIALFKLGSLSVWVSILTLALQVAAVLGMLLLGFVAWRFFVRS